MNPHLAMLLSPVYSGALAPTHRADLEKSGLTKLMIATQRIMSVPPSLIGKLLGFDLAEIISAMLFPFPDPLTGGWLPHVRVKIFPLLTDVAGHSVKYLQPKGSRPRLYFVRSVLDRVRYGDEPLWLVEGEKKSIAVAQLDFPTVGFCGVEGWHRKGSWHLVEDFQAIRLPGRVVELVPDGDVQTNPAVRRAVETLAQALTRAGARPRLVHLPGAS